MRICRRRVSHLSFNTQDKKVRYGWIRQASKLPILKLWLWQKQMMVNCNDTSFMIGISGHLVWDLVRHLSSYLQHLRLSMGNKLSHFAIWGKGCGYWGKPELTEEIFHARLNQKEEQRSFLRTGDMGVVRGGRREGSGMTSLCFDDFNLLWWNCRASHTGDAVRGRGRERERGMSSELANMTCWGSAAYLGAMLA